MQNDQGGNHKEHCTMRDFFAAHALSGYLAGLNEDSPWMIDFTQAAAHCYEIADAMLKTRRET